MDKKLILKKGIKKGIFFLSVIVPVIYFLSNFFTINRTASLPTGLYFMHSFSKLEKGDVVVFLPVKEAKNYLPKNTKYMMKNIGGVKGDKIKIVDDRLYINDEDFGEVFKQDITGKKLPRYNGAEIKEDEVFLVTKAKGSFDSRYWGTLKKDKIQKKAILIIKF